MKKSMGTITTKPTGATKSTNSLDRAKLPLGELVLRQKLSLKQPGSIDVRSTVGLRLK
jgi:hypothetical protein